MPPLLSCSHSGMGVEQTARRQAEKHFATTKVERGEDEDEVVDVVARFLGEAVGIALSRW